jgi:Polysaccharide lyase
VRLPLSIAGLAVSLTLLGTPSFASSLDPLYEDFEGSDFTPAGGLYYKRNKEQSAGTLVFQSEVTYRGKGALKLTVKPFCAKDDEDCSERAEVWEKPELWAPYDRGMWYGFAVKFAEPVPQDDHRYVIAQWKREIAGTKGDFSPFLALRMNKGRLFATVETNLVKTTRIEPEGSAAECADGETQVWLRPETNQTRALVATDADWQTKNGARFNACTAELTVRQHGNALPDAKSGWIDFAIYSKPGPGGTGHIEIFANDKRIVTVKGRIGHAEHGLGPDQYFKFGPYRAPQDNLWTLYYDEFRRSPHCGDVLKLAPCPF